MILLLLLLFYCMCETTCDKWISEMEMVGFFKQRIKSEKRETIIEIDTHTQSLFFII